MSGIGSELAKQSCESEISQIERPTVTVTLMRKKERLEVELDKVNEVLAVLAKHPDAQEVLDAVSSIRGII